SAPKTASPPGPVTRPLASMRMDGRRGCRGRGGGRQQRGAEPIGPEGPAALAVADETPAVRDSFDPRRSPKRPAESPKLPDVAHEPERATGGSGVRLRRVAPGVAREGIEQRREL